jgi:hypothetical protein
MSFYVPAIARITEADKKAMSAHMQITDESEQYDHDMLRSMLIADRFKKLREVNSMKAMVEQSNESRQAFEGLVDDQALKSTQIIRKKLHELPYHLTHGISNFNADSAIYGELPGIFGQTKPMVIKCKAKKARKVRRQFSKIPKAQRLIKKAQAVVPAARRPVEAKVKVEAPVEVKVETDVVVKTSSGRSIKRRVVLDV